MNIITFDIEEWYIARIKGYGSEKYEEYDNYLNKILALLEKKSEKATFFCVGEMGHLYPEVIKKIHKEGHEIGCHSNIHTWLNKMSESECREDTHRAIDSLEQCIGEKVKSYRAPAFSIGDSNMWVFEVLCENGIERDASVFPAARDFGGFPSFVTRKPCIIDYKGCRLKEYPICITKLFGKEIAYSGGGYFRLLPLWYVKKEMRHSEYNIAYFHIGDLIPEIVQLRSRDEYEAYFKEPGTFFNRYKRFIKGNIGRNGAWPKFVNLLEDNDMISIDKADLLINWTDAPVVVL